MKGLIGKGAIGGQIGNGGVGGSGGSPTVFTDVASANYDILATDHIVGTSYTATGAVTLGLPTALAIDSLDICIVDTGNGAQANNVTLTPAGGKLINGDTSAIIATNGLVVRLISDGTNFFVG